MSVITKTTHHICRLLLISIILLLTTIKESESCNFPEIPESEFEGELWIQNGLISYDQWKLLKPLYNDNISVPANELKVLKSIFPENSCPLPKINTLKKFHPWKKSDVNKFYEEYPELQCLSPILSFKNLTEKNKLTVSTKLEDEFQSNETFLKGSINVKNLICFNARAAYLDSIVRWERRSFSITTNPKTSIIIGNFPYNIDNGLLYGFIPHTSKPQKDPLKNWLYTNNEQWNGLKIEKEFNQNSISFLMHKKENEIISALKLDLQFDQTSLYTIISSNVIDSCDTSVTGSIGIDYSIGNSIISLSSLINSNNCRIFPIQLELKQISKKTRNLFNITYLPQEYKASRSSLYRYFSYRLTEKPTDKSDAFMLKNDLDFYFSKKFYSSYLSIILLNRDNYYLKQEFQMKYRSTISPLIKLRIDKSDQYLRSYITVRSELKLKKDNTLIPSFNIYLNNNRYYRFNWKLSSKSEIKKLTLQPQIQYSLNCKKGKSMILLLNSKIEITDRCFGYYKFSIRPFDDNMEKIKIYLGQSFNL